MRPASFVARCAFASLFIVASVTARAQSASASAVAIDLSSLAGQAPAQSPSTAFDGTRYLIVWEEAARIWGAVLDESGSVVAPRFEIAPPAEAGAAQATPAVAAAAAGGFLVVWAESGASEWDVRAARVSTEGTVLDPLGFAVSLTSSGPVPAPAPGPQQHPAVAAGAGEFLVVWQDGGADGTAPRVVAAIVRANGTLAFPDGIVVSQSPAAHRNPSVASNGAGYVVAWESLPAGGTTEVVLAPVSAAGVADPERTVATAANDQLAPAIASNGGGYLVLWNDARPAGAQLTCEWVSDRGVPDSTRVAVVAGAPAPYAVASDGIGYVASYERAGVGAAAARISAVPAAAQELVIDGSASPAGQALAFAGYGRYLEVHLQDASGAARLAGAFVTTTERMEVRVTGDGRVTAQAAGIDCGTACSAEVETGTTLALDAVAGAGSRLVAWSGCTPTTGTTTCTVILTGSASITATFAALPGAAGVPTYTNIAAATVTVTWTAAPDARTHELERAPDVAGSAGAFARVFAGAATTYDDGGLSPSTTYWYRARGVNDAGAGEYGPATSVTTLPLAPVAPAAPTFPSVGATSVMVSWTTVANATRYDVERADVAGGPWASAATALSTTMFTDASLSANRTFWYRVRGSGPGGDGAFSTPSGVTTRPTAPGTPTFSSVAAQSVVLTWTAPLSGADGYVVERALASGADWTELAKTGELTWTDGSVAPETAYQYRVRATNVAGAGDPSAPASVTTLPLAPATATAPTYASIGDTSVVVSWTAVAGATGYDLERGATSGGTWTSIATNLAGTSRPETSLSPNATYWYRVRATNAGGTGAFSTASSVLTLPAAPAAPALGTVTGASVTVTWAAPAGGATAYVVERATGGAGTWSVAATGVTATTHVDAGLAPNTTYTYRVRATNATGAGAASPVASATTLAAAPGAPAFSAVTATGATVSWTAPTGGAATYDVERATSSTGTFTPVATGLTALSATASGLAEGTAYWYRVRGVNATGPGPYSTASRLLTLPGAPGTPTFPTVGATSVSVSWGAAAGAASYKVERAPDVGGVPGAWTEIAAGASPPYTSGGLRSNARYWYRVRATDASGDGAYSGPAAVTTVPDPPGSPTYSAITVSSLTVAWTAPSTGAAAYRLERATSDTGPWTVLSTSTAPGFTDSGLSAGTTYWYRVSAANADGLWGAPAVSSVPTLPDAARPPTFSAIGPDTVTVSWPAIAGATSYKLEVAATDTGTWTQVAAPPVASYAAAGLTANTTYWYRVRATNASGDGAYSPPASVMTVPNTPDRPTVTAATTTSLTLAWTVPPQGAATYDLERAPSATGPWTRIVTGTTALGATDTGLAAGMTYLYHLRTVNAVGGASAWSVILSAPTLPDNPGAPTYTGISTVSLTVQWTPIPGATTYHVERAPDVSGQPGTWTVVAAGLVATYFNDAVAANTVYWYRVRGANASGYGAYSPESSVATLTNAPGAPAFSDVTTTSVTLSWTAPPGGGSSYVVERAPAATGPWTVVRTGVTALTYVDTPLSAGTQYWYRMRAANATGAVGAASAIAAVTTIPEAPSGAPAAPTFPTIDATVVTVAWTDASSATSWKVERAPDAGITPGAWTELTTVWDRSYVDRTLSPNTQYWYRVRGTTAGGPGPYSTAAWVITAPGVPGVPTPTAAATTSSVALGWTEPAGGATRYAVDRASGATGPWATVGEVSTRAYTDGGLSPGTTYWYRVRALNTAGVSGAASGSRAVVTVATSPGAPSYIAVGATSLTVQWAPAQGAAWYQVERSTAGGAWLAVASGVAGTSFTDLGVSPNTAYAYRITATNAAGASGAYSPATGVTTLPGAPGAPAFDAITRTSVSLAWTAPAGGAASYVVERAPDQVGPWTAAMRGVATPTYVDATLAAGTTYWYRIRATSTAGADGLPSAARAVTTTIDASAVPSAPGAPTFSGVSSTLVTLRWTTAANAASYRIERAPGGTTAWTEIATSTGTVFTDGFLAQNTEYLFRVRGTNAAGDGPYSPASSVVTAPGAPSAPAFSAVAAASITIVWTAPAGGAATYQLERAPSAVGPWSILAPSLAAVTFTDVGVSGNGTYHYRARASNAAGTPGPYSPIAAVTTPPDTASTVPGIPGTPAFPAVTDSAVRVSWTAATNATGYVIERAAAAAGPWTGVGTVGSTPTFMDATVAANTTYWYRVRGTTAGGDGPRSAAASVTTAPSPPGAPVFSGVSANAVTASWAVPASGAATYAVERAPATVGPWVIVASGVVSTTWADTGLSGSTTYWYRVRAASAGGTYGAYSPAQSVTTAADGGISPPDAPGTPIFSSVAMTYVAVQWLAAAGATRYELERALGTATTPGTWSPIATGLSSPGAMDASLAPNTRYWYRARGVNAGGAGPYSAASPVMTAPSVPGPPVYSAVTASTLTVSWTAPAGGAGSYKLERAMSIIGPWEQIATGIPSPSYADASLAASTTYFYRVRATNADGRDGSVSSATSIVTGADAATPIAGAPGAPVFSNVAATSVKLSWSAGTFATSYKIERADASTGPWVQVASVAITSFSDTGRSANASYWYRVRGVNGAGDGLASDAASVTTAPNAPGAPTFTAVAATTLTVTWSAPPGGSATYELQRATSSAGPWSVVATGLTATSFADSGLTAATTWYYRVVAANADGVTGAYSLTRSVGTAPAPGL